MWYVLYGKTDPRRAVKLASAAIGGAVVLSAICLFGAVGESDSGTVIVGQRLDIAQVPTPYQPWIKKAASTCPAVSGALLPAQLEQESGWNPRAHSPAGAQGLAQFLPATWETWAVDADGGGADISDGADAIMTMARYDCWLAARAEKLVHGHQATGDVVSLMLASYNAGPAAVEKHHGIPPYPETEHYIRTIIAGETDYILSPGNVNANAFGARVAAAAVKVEGTPYAWGGESVEEGFDCSGLVQYAVRQASGGKIVLPRTSEEQVTVGEDVSRENMQPGDVIAFQLVAGDYDHIGIYLGKGIFIHAPHTGEVVKKERLSNYGKYKAAIRRFG